ncbi:MAG: type II toxin-antitoxin system Phd/YefM family antitoxin [Armatimonadota bacterium]
MRVVSASEFRTKISHYVRLVKRGEEIVVTLRGKPVAIATPVAADDNTKGGDSRAS